MFSAFLRLSLVFGPLALCVLALALCRVDRAVVVVALPPAFMAVAVAAGACLPTASGHVSVRAVLSPCLRPFGTQAKGLLERSLPYTSFQIAV